MKKRQSHELSRLKNELRKRALHEDDEEKRRDYWRLYYKAIHAEHEVRALVMDAEMRRLLDFVFPNGLPSGFDDEPDKPNPQSKKKPDDDSTLNDDDIPPRQKGLWE